MLHIGLLESIVIKRLEVDDFFYEGMDSHSVKGT